MKRASLLATVATSLCSAFASNADVLYVQSPANSGTILHSSYWDPDGSDYDEYVWDGFLLPAAANITEIQWRGGYYRVTGAAITSFEISIYASIPAGTQPDLGYLYPGPLMHRFVTGNAGETLVGNVGGTTMYDYHYTLPTPFLAAANTRYWVQIEAWQAGIPNWGLATGTGGNNSHFHCTAGAGDKYYFTGSFDSTFSLIGTPAACAVPTITLNPTPVVMCSSAGTAIFSAAATGSGTFAYRWRLSGNPVYDGPNGGGHGGGAYISGATTATLTIVYPSSWADVGTYDCMISNACGPAFTAGATLTFSVAPTISNGPADAKTCSGGSRDFSVIASGSSALAYRWQIESAPVGSGLWGDLFDGPINSGAAFAIGADTDLLSIIGADAAAAARYRCVVSDACTGIASSAATLSVCDHPGDTNCDAVVDEADLGVLLGNWLLSVPPFTAGDLDGSGVVDSSDLGILLADWGATCP
ncbi:MAG: dockerin type I repeat-containing protein [Phycisphaerae bacterium]